MSSATTKDPSAESEESEIIVEDRGLGMRASLHHAFIIMFAIDLKLPLKAAAQA